MIRAIRFLLALLLVVCAVIGAFAVGVLVGEERAGQQSAIRAPSAAQAVVEREFRVQGEEGELPEESEEALLTVRNADEIAAAVAQAVYRMDDALTVRIVLPDSLDGDEEYDYLLELLSSGLSIARRDNADIFWMSLGSGYSFRFMSIEDGAACRLKMELPYCYEPAEIERIRAEVDTALDQVVAQAPDGAYEQVRFFHDWVVENTVYNHPAAEADDKAGLEYAYNANGVLLNGSAVCDGYAKVFRLLCDRVGIPAVCVVGDAGEMHAWNYVQLEGSWYHVDCTFDDVGSGTGEEMLYWEYFLRGSTGVVGGTTISETYTPKYGGYPTLSSTDYEGGTHTLMADGGEIYRVELQLEVQLIERTQAVQTGSWVGTVVAIGEGSGYTYLLSGEGADDHRFQLDSGSGALYVADGPLPAGEYELVVRVNGGTELVSYVVVLEVLPAWEEQRPPMDLAPLGPDGAEEQQPPPLDLAA